MVADELAGVPRLVLGAFDGLRHGLLAAGQQHQQALARPVERRHQLGAVLHGQPPRGAGAGIDQTAAAAQPGLDAQRGLFDCGTHRLHRGDGRQLAFDQGLEDVLGLPEVDVRVAWA